MEEREKGKGRSQNQRLKLLYLLKYLLEETDETHTVKAQEISDHLFNHYRIPVEQKTVCSDLHLLDEYGYEVQYDGRTKGWQLIEKQSDIERNHILDFHVRFEEIFPFEDSNGRVGRLLMFKECLRHNVMPFIIDDKRRSRYLRGIKEWHTDRYELVDVVMEAQDRFEAQIELQKLCAHTRLYLPAEYKED